jgi:hypothetical protein
MAAYILWCSLTLGPAAAQDPAPPVPLAEAPAPVPAGPPVAVRAIQGGYTITLSRSAAERVRDALANADEKQIAQALRDEAKRRKDDPEKADDAAKLELVALIVSSQIPAFKKAFAEKVGPHGAVVTVTGLQAPAVKFRKPRPKLEKAAEVVRGVMPLLPGEARDVLEALRAVGRTTPLFWQVDPR